MFEAEVWWGLWTHFQVAIMWGLVPVLAVALSVGLLACVTRSMRLVQFAFLFAVLGAGLGVLLGSSREPAVKAFLPAIITLLGGLVVYVFPARRTGSACSAPTTRRRRRRSSSAPS